MRISRAVVLFAALPLLTAFPAATQARLPKAQHPENVKAKILPVKVQGSLREAESDRPVPTSVRRAAKRQGRVFANHLPENPTPPRSTPLTAGVAANFYFAGWVSGGNDNGYDLWWKVYWYGPNGDSGYYDIFYFPVFCSTSSCTYGRYYYTYYTTYHQWFGPTSF